VLVVAAFSYERIQSFRENAEVLEDLNMKIIIVVSLFVAGGTVFAAILGLIAVAKRIKKLLMLYVVLVFILFAVQLAMGALLLQLTPEDALNAFREDSEEGLVRRESFQNYMECCGWDYLTEEFFPERVACLALHPTYKMTCRDAVQDFLDTWLTPLGILLLATGSLTLLAVVGSLLVICNNRSVKAKFADDF